MSSRDRDTKSLQDKLKVFFKKGASAQLPARNELAVTAELQRELGTDSPLHRRLRAVRDLTDRALHLRIQEGGVEKIWGCTRDLLDDSNAENRHAVLGLLRNIAEGQADQLQIMRTILFHYLRDTHPTHSPDDTHLRFKLLHTLTNSGKNINCFEEQMGPFVLEWLPQIQSPALLVEFLQLVTNVVKFNATYLDDNIVHGIVQCACSLCVYCAEGGVVSHCLALLEAVVSYSLLPRAALRTFVEALCRTVNTEHYCQISWKLMRYVVGGDIGHAALLEMVEILRGCPPPPPPPTEPDAGLLRGAVFYINMALWGPRRVPTLKVSFLAVLPAFLKALEGGYPVVTYEVVAGVHSAVTRAPLDLCESAWDVLIRILHVVLRQDKSYDPPNEMIHTKLHALITTIEQMADSGQYRGEQDALLDLVDAAGQDRPEASSLRLVSARAASLSATSSEWVTAALQLADRYLRHESRMRVRVHTLEHLMEFIRRHRYVYGSELVELVGVPVLTLCALDASGALRACAAGACAALCAAPALDAATDLIDLLEKILNRPFETPAESPLPPDGDTADLRRALAGLLHILHDKLLSAPGALALRCLLVLAEHLDLHYKRPALLRHHTDLRLKILDMLFGLRANSFNCVGFCYESAAASNNAPPASTTVMVTGTASLRMKPLCSPFLLVEPPLVRGQQSPPQKELPPGSCLVPVGRLARLLVAALTREVDWAVLGCVLRALPALLQARALCVGRRAQDLDVLASTLCSMISDRSLALPDSLRASAGQRPLASEFHNAVLPGLAAMAPYHSYLEPHTQQRIVRCLLKYGMVLRTPQPYINALTIFTLETRDTMVKMLPEVLLDLSKISDTQAIASPMLEFLSTLTRLPKVFASFVEDQYMSVFAILLPYTNPSRYNHYVVSLAHHVIAAWFLKCRLSYRRNFVRFIIHGLHNYTIMPFEEQLHSRTNSSQQNEDSSNRQRSSSLGSRAVPRAVGAGAGAGAMRGGSASAAFHVELTETCVDLLARYTSTPCSSKPTRSETAEFLFSGGQSMSWLVGHKLVTVTTSGCHQNSLKQGLCDRCAVLCKQHADSISSPLPPLNTPAPPELENLQTEPPQFPSQIQVQVNDSESEANSQSNAPEVKRQNSSENSKASDPLVEILNHFTQRFERISKEVDSEEALWWRSGASGGGGGSGACACWCAAWAELHVRAPTGDVRMLLRLQNQMNWNYMLESPLEDVAALLHWAEGPPTAPAPPTAPPIERHELSELLALRPTASSHRSRVAPASELQDLHKSSSDSVVASDKKHQASQSALSSQQLRMSTQPINIPGSPQRVAAAVGDHPEEMLLIVPEGKSRHPVRRSNSSPEMSSSWKAAAAAAAASVVVVRPEEDLPLDPDEMILLPSCEPTNVCSNPLGAGCKKPAKKSDTRVSCEAIPEEISGTSPHPLPHPPPAAFHSDPAITGLRVVGAAPGETAPLAAPLVAPPTAPLGAYNKHHQLQKTASDSTVPEGRAPGGDFRDDLRDDLPPLARSKRSNTISVMSPTRRHRPPSNPSHSSSASGGGSAASGASSGASSGAGGGGGGGVTPAFVFLQLYHNMSTYPITPPVPGEAQSILNPLAERPLRVAGAQHERAIKNLDLVPPTETYKVGVLYVGAGQQDDEVAILRNEYGSVRYAEFLRQLGSLVPLGGGEGGAGLLGGEPLFLNLETGGKDGQYTYVWHDDIMQVQFHVATAMPNSEADPSCNEKRKYIGNDFVSIVYNDSGADFHINTIKGQLNLCVVVVEPLEGGLHAVRTVAREARVGREFLPHAGPCVVSDGQAALLARQVALHAALAAHVAQSLAVGAPPYASNSLERLRAIKRLRRRVEAERVAAAARAEASAPYADRHSLHQRVAIDDFNDYT